nr:reverse transcriptase domain-containing protein [Tanacetum cinerariifolium]
TMAYVNVNAPADQAPIMAPPTRTDGQILPHIRRVPIGKSNCYLDVERSQSNPIYKIAMDILKHTNFFRAFTASSTIPSIYIQHQIWLEKETPRSIQAWDDLVSKFINQFFPPSKTTNLRNEIMRFQQRFDESFYEAWDRFNDLLKACLHHGFFKLNQLDTFYNALNVNDQDSLNSDAAGNFLDQNAQRMLENNREQVQSSSITSKGSRCQDKKNQSSASTSSPTHALVKAVEPNCVTCVVKQGTEVTKDQVQTPSSQSTAPVQPSVSQSETPTLVSEPVVAPVSAPMPNLKSFIPYPSRRDNERRHDQANEQIDKFYEIFKDMSFEISFTDALILMPKFASTLKALIGNKEKLSEMARTPMNEHCSAVILNKLQRKLRDPGKFLIPCEFPGMDECLALVDLGASINLMPFSVWEALSLLELTLTCMTLELVDRSVSKPIGIAKDVSFKVVVFHFPADFVVVDFEPDPRVSLILGRCFLKTGRPLIDVHKGELTLRIGNEAITYNLDQTEVLGFSDVTTSGNPTPYDDLIVSTTSPTLTPFGDSDFLLFEEADAFLGLEDDPNSSKINPFYYDPNGDILMLEAILNSEPLPTLPNHEQHLPSFKKKLKFMGQPDTCVPKKGGFTVVENEENELIPTHLVTGWRLIPTHLVTGWRVCIDYRKLNEATRKDHFPLPFMDQMLEILAGNEFYCFLDGFFGYFQIPIDPRDQEKTTFKCPYGTFTYRRMPFGLCNAPGTFQRCMLDIFHDMVENTMEVFMDDFSVFGNYFENFLSHLDQMLQRCEDTNLSLKWEKSHFMVKEGIVLGHKISKNGIEVDRAKVDAIAKLPHPTTAKGVWSFLGHAGADLGQRHEKHFKSIHYASKTLNDAESNYTTAEKEMLAVVYAFENFQSYLIMNKIIVHTDHSALKYLFAKKDAKARLLRWVLLLQEFDFKVLDTKGAENLMADHLSQLENPYENDYPDYEVFCALSFSFTRASHTQLHFRNPPSNNDKTARCYKCQLDEQWFDLIKDTLIDALQITPVNNNNAFSSPPSFGALINFVNDLAYPKVVRNLSNVVTNNMFQPWRALTTIINLCLTGKTSGFERPRALVLQILWGVVNQAHTDYAERIWEKFAQSIRTFIEDKKNLAQHTYGKKKATLTVILSIRFTKLIIYYLQRKHKFHLRLDSPLHLPNEEPVLGYLKFSAKGTKREVFGMPIPGNLITADIQGEPYYKEYLEKVAKHQRYLAGEKRNDPDSPAPKPAKATKKSKPSAHKVDLRPPVTKPALSQQPKPKPAPAKSVGEFVDEGIPEKEPRFDNEEAEVQRALEESLKSVYNAPRGPLPSVVIRELESGKCQPLPEMPKKKSLVDQFIFQRRTSTPTESSGHDESSSLYVKLRLINSEVESDEDVSGIDVGVQNKGQAGPKPGEQDEGQAGPNPDVSTQPYLELMDEGFTTTAYPKVQENLKLTVEEHVILEKPASSTETLSSL